MILKCGCEILSADSPEGGNKLGPEVQRERISFCQMHHDELIRLIEENGGVPTADGKGIQIQPGELPVKILNLIEKFIENIIFSNLEGRIKKPEENN